MGRRVQTNFTAADFADGETERKAAPKEEPRPARESNEVPVGTSAEIQDWVGDDKERAQRALDKENENANPRKGLVKHLESMLDESDDEGEDDE